VKLDALAAGLLADGCTGAVAYADAVNVYIGLAIDKATDYNSSLVLWSPTRDQVKTTFSRQATTNGLGFCGNQCLCKRSR